MPTILEPSDLAPFAEIALAKASAMIADALASAARVAPCITSEDFTEAAAARAILRGAVLRWHETGISSYAAQAQGPPGYPVAPRERRNLLWPSEIAALRELCNPPGGQKSGAFSVDTVGSGCSPHADTCALIFGAAYCSCGAVLTNFAYPLYESQGWP